MSQNNAKISADYSAKVNKKFDENHGKLFLVDYSKSCALQALSELLARKDYETTFFVVDDVEVAEEFAVALKSLLGEMTIVKNYADFEGCLATLNAKEKSTSDVEMKGIAAAFKKQFPCIIFTATDEEGKPLLHRSLCKDSSKSGVYNGVAKKSEFCISDFISACRYDFVVLDNIYGRLAFETLSNKKKKYDCGQYERITFLGNAYYAPTEYSYKRLNNIIDGSKKTVAISDIVVDRDAVNLYAVLELLHGDFPYADVQKKIAGMTSNYAEDCERTCTDLSYCKEDETILSACLQKLKGSKQNVPADIESLKKYLDDCLEYMSEEEIFLKLTYAQLQNRFKGQCGSLESILETLENGSTEMANCICSVFFDESMKTEVEGSLKTSHICNMTEDQVAAMFEIFLRYGVYHPFPQKNDGCQILRLKRDDSGFESFVRAQSSTEDDENCYSITKEGSARLYKCIALQRLLDGRCENNSAQAPVLIVANRNLDKIREILQNLLPDYDCTEDIHVLAQEKVKDKTIVLVDYPLFRETALWLHVHTVVFFDILADAVILKNLINKAMRYREVKVFLIANYGDMSGHLVDIWQDELLSTKQKAMPIDNSEISLKDGSECSYEEIVEATEEVYSALEKLTSVGQKKQIAPAAEKYNKLLSDYTLKSTVPMEELEQDFTYLVAMSKYYNGIVKNCISIGGKGEEVILEKLKFVKIAKEVKKKKKKKAKKIEVIEERKDVFNERKIYFNACAGMLRRGCDIKQNNCNGCENYKKFRKNDFAAFEKNVETLFEKSKAFVLKMEHLRFLDKINETISSQEQEAGKVDRLVLDEIERYEGLAKEALEKIKEAGKGKTLFGVDYALVADVCKAAEKTYCKLLKKYYATVMDIFYRATDAAKHGFKTISDSFLSAHGSV